MDEILGGKISLLFSKDKNIINRTNDKGQTILHLASLDHDIEFVFTCIQLDCDKYAEDIYGKKFYEYLEQWEYKSLRLLNEAYKYKKMALNICVEKVEIPQNHVFTSNGAPSFSIIWEEKQDPENLREILEKGTDLDSEYLQKYPPEEESIYRYILFQYGWVQTLNPNINRDFYPSNIWSTKQVLQKFTTKRVESIPKGYLFQKTFVCLSDTHWAHNKLHIPGGDILICCGDICIPPIHDYINFIKWFGGQSHKYKILVCGNHDKEVEKNKEYYIDLFKKYNIIYLEDSGITIENIKIWGSPWTSRKPNGNNNAFTLDRRNLMNKWNKIPADTNILITHTPPYKIGDLNTDYFRVNNNENGDYGLLKTINRLENLKMHVFGHQHYGRGIYKGSNGVYFVNCAIINHFIAYIFD